MKKTKLKKNNKAELGYSKLILIILALLLLLFLIIWVTNSSNWIEKIIPNIFRVGR